MAQYLSNLPVGAKVKFGRHSINGETPQEIIWQIVAKSHSGYPADSVTLFTERIIDIRMMDNKEPDNPVYDRTMFGSNRYEISNLDQWLNSYGEAGQWYVAKSEYDKPPTNNPTAYYNRPGFLYHFTNTEKNAILDTPLLVTPSSIDGGIVSFTRKVFIPSFTEVTGRMEREMPDGVKWDIGYNYDAYVTQQVIDYSESYSTPTRTNIKFDWWTRTAAADSYAKLRALRIDRDELGARYTYAGEVSATADIGVRPALNLSSSVIVSDTTDADGCYTLTLNNAPTVPLALNIPTIYGGKTNSISWSPAVDVDGDIVLYELDCAYDGGEFSNIYNGASTSYNHLVTLGANSIQYRIRAYDSKGGYSGYTTSAVVSVINNNLPVISGADENLGVKNDTFTQTYSVTDEDNDSVTVVEAINGEEIRSHIVNLDQTYVFSVTGTTWLKLSNGSHTMTITATDSRGGTSVRTYTFVKSVSSLSITTTPMIASSMPTRISLNVTKNIPVEAIFKVEVCNNGYDAEPTWEDATSAVETSQVHVFTNTSKTADAWAVILKITVDRNGGEGACYISAIGGNFE